MTLGFDALYDGQAAYVLRTLRRLGVADADALDEAQNVFVALHRHLTEFDDTRPLKPWVFGFCHHVAANYRRLAYNRHPSAELSPDLHSDASPERDMGRREARSVVLVGLEGLDETLRSIFCMYELDGFTAPEIAGVLEIPVKSVYVHIKTARRRFRAHLDSKGLP